MVQVIRRMIQKDGIFSFYKGFYMALIGTVVSFGSYFYNYRLFKNLLM